MKLFQKQYFNCKTKNFKLISMIRPVMACQLEVYYTVTDYIPWTVCFILITHLFCSWRFRFPTLPHLFLFICSSHSFLANMYLFFASITIHTQYNNFELLYCTFEVNFVNLLFFSKKEKEMVLKRTWELFTEASSLDIAIKIEVTW